MLINREGLALKIEPTPGTDSVPSPSIDAVMVENLAWSYDNARMVERPAIRGGSTAQLKQIWADTLFQVTFSVEMKGAGAVYSASVFPEAHVPFRCSGHSATLNAGAGVETWKYAPASDQATHEYCSMYYWSDGLLFKGLGCQATVEFTIDAGQRFMANFTMKGHTVPVIDAVLPALTLSAVEPPIVKGSAFLVDSYAATISKLSFSPNWEMSTPASVSASDGFGKILLGKRDTSGSINPNQQLVSEEDFIGNWRTGKNMALASGDIGSVQYNKVHMEAPAVAYRMAAPGENEMNRTNEMDFGMHEVTGDDDYTITFD